METTQRCPCCQICEDCPYFQNAVNIKSVGLIIYHYSTCEQSVNSHTGKTKSPTPIEDTLILHNTKSIDIASEKLIPILDQYKKCPRCKYILEHAEKLLLYIPTINKLDVLGICENCRTEDRKGISSCRCREAIEKFISIKKQKKNKATKEGKERKLKLEKLLNRFIKKDEQSKKSYDRTRSESNLINICLEPSPHKSQPQVGPLIETKKEFRRTNLTEIQQGKIRFSKSMDTIQFTCKNYFDTELAELDRKFAHLGSKSKLRKALRSDENINSAEQDMAYLEAGSRNNEEYPLKLISLSQESLTFNLHDITDKSTKLQSLYKMSEQHKKYLHRPPLHVQKHKQEPSILDIIAEQKEKSREVDTMGTPRKPISATSDMETTLPKYPSDFSVLVKKKDFLYGDFSYFFLKEAEPIKKTIQKSKSSSELIKDTQDMLLAREEELKKIYKEKLIRKFDEEERKEITRKRMMRRLKKVKKDTPSEASKKSVTKTESKHDQIAESNKSQNQKSRQEKEDNLTLEKKQKLEEKEKLKREKEEQSKNKKEKREKKKDELSIKETQMRAKDKGQSLNPPEKKEQHRKGKETQEKVKEELGGIDKKLLQKNKEEQGEKQKDKLERGKKEKSFDEKQNHEKEEKPGIKSEIEEQMKNSLKKRPLERVEEEIPGSEKKKVHSLDRTKAKEEAELKLKALREIKSGSESKLNIPENKTKNEEPKIKELNINQIKFSKPSPDDLLLQLVKLKQSEQHKMRKKPRTLSEINIPFALIAEHRAHKTIQMNSCVICNDSELELDIEEILLTKAKSTDKADIIIGQKIFKYKPPFKSDEKQIDPIFVSTFKDDLINVTEKNADNVPTQSQRKPPPMIGKYVEHENTKGVIRYALSDRTFIEKGWTMLPTEKVVRKMNVYRMRPAHPEFDWFEHNKNKKIMQYESGEKLAEFDDNGRGRLYYRSGRLALDYYDAEEVNAQQRFVIHSSGDLDARGCTRPLAILATFDYLGNGIVFDHTGKIRLKYNQTEGVVLDRSIGPVSHWKWHTLNDPPVLQQVMIDTQMAHKDPDILKLGGPMEGKPRPDNEEMLAIEFDNFIKEKSKKLSQKFKPFQIKMKALKINEHFSLRVLDQATIYLIFRDGSTNIKLNLGMILDHQEIVDTDTAEVGEVSNSLERFPARTDSLAGLQNSIAYAQRVERARVERERRLRPTQPFSSSDKLTAAISRPLRTPLHTAASDSTVATCKCRKPPSNNLYYDTRFL